MRSPFVNVEFLISPRSLAKPYESDIFVHQNEFNTNRLLWFDLRRAHAPALLDLDLWARKGPDSMVSAERGQVRCGSLRTGGKGAFRCLHFLFKNMISLCLPPTGTTTHFRSIPIQASVMKTICPISLLLEELLVWQYFMENF